MHCFPREYVGSLAAITFLGCAFGSILLPFSGDIFGRWNAGQFLCLLTLPIFYLSVVADSFGLVQFVAFWIGLLTFMRYANIYLLLMELMEEQYTGIATAIFMCGDSAMGFYLIVYLRFISKDCFAFLQLSIILSIISFVLYYFLPESPKWLVSVGRYDEARTALKKMAYMNGCDPNVVDDKLFNEEVHVSVSVKSTASENLEEESLSVVS